MSQPPSQEIVAIPHSIEAEQSLLGSILLNPRAYYSVANLITSDSFFYLSHSEIWEAMSSVLERAEPLDIVTLSFELNDKGKLEDIGGRAYLTRLANNTPTHMHIEVYAQLVDRVRIRREMLVAADKIRQLALDNEMPVPKGIEESEQALFSVGQVGDAMDFVPMYAALAEYYEELEKVREDGIPIGIPTGFKKLDELMGGLQKSDLLIVAGRPGMGKTAWLLTTALRIARMGKKVAYFTLEMGANQIVGRLLSIESGVTMQQMRTGDIGDSQWKLLLHAISQLSDLPLYIDASADISPISMRRKCRRLQHEESLDVVIVDYMQLMSADDKYRNNRVQEISYISRALKEMARELNVTMLSAAQLNRSVEQRANKRPMLSDLRESGTIEQDADAVMFLYRDEVYNPETTEQLGVADLNLAKHRHGETGTIQMIFEAERMRFIDAVITHHDTKDWE